ncbi:MAG: hypothetical protein H6821_14890 [Planctomycetaceae bacterium]|nr:hypothetical protein [Planctomycetales bacterium]MCB9875457.1 hypothetical protein [Planctomycetaceae bacterium]
MTLFFREVCAGQTEAMQPLWNFYFPRLMQLASRTLGNGLRISGPDDAVQSAFLAFWQQAEAGSLKGEFHRDNLWAMLSVITVRKVKQQIRRETAAVRGGRLNRVGMDAIELAATDARNALASVTPQEFDIHSEELLMLLDDTLREFAILKLMGNTNQEIAAARNCTERTVERKLQMIRLAWQAEAGPT